MNAIADKYADQDIGSYFLYTHEAHPGEVMPPLRSMEQKFEHAAKLREIYGVTRPILVDALDGPCHRRYGSQPNMTWIFNRSGTPIYKSDWTDSHSVDSAIAYYLDVTERRKNKERLAPFNVQRIDYRNQDQEQFYAGLERNGPRAVTEFKEAF